MNLSIRHRMKPLLTCALAVLALGPGMLRPVAVYAQTQMAMDVQAQKEFNAADAELNRVYKKLMARVDKKSQEKLKKAQRAWVAFRDDEADFHSDAMARGGTLLPLDYSETAKGMTQMRTRELEAMLKDLAI